MFLGSREEMGHVGYIAARCPKCAHQGLFSVYEARRKLTVMAFVGVPLSQQIVIECPSCGVRMGIPPEQAEQVQQQMITADRMAHMAAHGANGAGPAQAPHQTAAPRGRTAYQVLQVDPMAEQEVVDAAYKRLALKYHPDTSKAPDASERMREIIEAYGVLTDPKKRERYDASIGIRRPVKMPPAMRASDV
ncbi:MAG TPA: DnaJ domain-containing protein [Thermomicrobiales bacterium]|nr:DnaJ domain-containing protein [Thermomicrobiales bacterium]